VVRARKLRRNETDAEHKLWTALRDRRLEGTKFVRQYPIGRYVADFVCPDRMLVVEVDGGQHSESGADAARTAFMNARGYSVAPATLSLEGRGAKGAAAATTKHRSYHLTADIPRLTG
jgi:very-short-patch-repair endonuclease